MVCLIGLGVAANVTHVVGDHATATDVTDTTDAGATLDDLELATDALMLLFLLMLSCCCFCCCY